MRDSRPRRPSVWQAEARAAALAERDRAEAESRARREAEEAREREAERARLEAAERKLRADEERAVAAAQRARLAAADRKRREREAREQALAEDAAERARVEKLAKERRLRPKPARSHPTPKLRPASRGPSRAPPKARPAPPGPSPAPPQAPRPPAPRREPPSLARPTAKLGSALLAAGIAAIGLGSLLGLPAPLDTGTGTLASSAALRVSPLDAGIAASLYRGPYHPVRGEVDYGEKDARFGALRSGHIHEGQDMFAKKGTPLVAVRDGVVVDGESEKGRFSGGRGNYVVIYNPIEDRSYVYMHLLKPALVQRGERVHAGEILGLMGCSGSCFGTHLHFEVRLGKATLTAETKPIDPLPFLEDLPQAPEDLGKPD